MDFKLVLGVLLVSTSVYSFPAENEEGSNLVETQRPVTEAPNPETAAPLETQPPETQPPETQPPETQPPETQPPETEPPETKPPETEPPETKPPETKPPETEPPVPTTKPQDGYERIGCFKDRSSRALPVLYANYRNSIKWSNMKLTVDACAKQAMDKGYEVFAVQFYGECWSGPNAGITYDKYGPAPDTSCWNGVGRDWTNYVYRLTSG